MIYVDEPKTWNRHFPEWCHMWTDADIDGLHCFAHSIGLKRSWFQDRAGFPHYDLSPVMRDMAIAHGAEFMPLRPAEIPRTN